MIVDCVSDLHGYLPNLDGGDLLIVAGDLTSSDKPEQYEEFFSWLKNQSYNMKVFTLGNHDNQAMSQFDWYDAELLLDSGLNFEGFKIWGFPWTLKFPKMNPQTMAFTVENEKEMARKLLYVPDDIDILVSHSPGWGLHDEVQNMFGDYTHCGSKSITRWRAQHCNSLKLHVYGHIHEGYGVYDIRNMQRLLGDAETVVMVNASYVNHLYEPTNPPLRIIL